jgi:hypothetical protein
MNDFDQSLAEQRLPNRKRKFRLAFSLGILIGTITTLAFLLGVLLFWIGTQHERFIQLALLEGQGPSFWWPTTWRQELRESTIVEGGVTMAGKPVNTGTVWFILESEHRRFPAKIKNGRFSMNYNRIPAGRYRIEVISEDGVRPQSSKSKWEMPIGPGFLRFNLAF